MNKIRPTFLPGICWLLLVTVLLTLPGSAFPSENWLSRIWFDKWVHVGLFAILVILWCWGLLRTFRDPVILERYYLLFMLACLGFGIGMEFVQRYFVTNRSFDTGDIIADGLGCLAGWFYSRRRYIKK